ncbi:hypothetical protein [Burkholderia pseudomultivorans]|uniref:Radical SAM protein n=1 Tax=Burkholderia pseudomultivorans TaxID=1207504 RepID=A0A132EYJ1_9BURK|nr:hypothetical protein [Burkholderia pseudomultivorans]KWF63260.1 hypothetical protein WT57_22835 [Burkholderia pseudomultivorans]
MSRARSLPTIPLVPVADANGVAPLVARSRAFGALAERFAWLALREPPAGDRARWHAHQLGARTIRFAQPLTFTPYAAAQPCSARCRFCSETLVDDTVSGPMLPALAGFGLSWLEWSRHHDRDDVNQSIMRFRPGQPVMRDAAFETAFAAARAHFPVKLVCIVQRGGIETPADVLRYLDRARALGASTVIFREFSVLPDTYRHNATRRYIDRARIAIDALLLACVADPGFSARCEPIALTGGYYFWNARWAHRDGFEVVFETSDYGAMREHELRDAVYKLVFHPNGNLCAGWQPTRDILWSDDDHRD